jgi:dienelactone hydrolase
MYKKSFLIVLTIAVFSVFVAVDAFAASDPSVTGTNAVCQYSPPANLLGYISAQVYYPCTISGTVPATTMTGGFTNTWNNMDWISKHLASHGFIVFAMTPLNNLGFNDTWVTAHQAGISMLKSENTRTGSKIKGKVNTAKLQVCGYSKGGGGAVLAANNLGSGLAALQAMAPYMDSYLNSLSNVKAKAALYTGSLDVIASPDGVVSQYNLIPASTKKLLVKYNGVDHLAWISDMNLGGLRKYYITAWMYYNLSGVTTYNPTVNKDMLSIVQFLHN